MSLLSIIYAVLFNVAALVLVLGVGLKIRGYARTPVPLKISTTPAPLTRFGVAWRLMREVLFFESLYKSSKWTWIFGWLFHMALLMVTLRHLRYFQQPVWSIVAAAQPLAPLAGIVMIGSLGGLWARRILVDRVRYISTPSDHLMLALLLGIGLSGFLMRFVARTDIVAVKGFMLGLMYLDWQPLPPDPVLLVHLALVALLMLVFPISKLIHAPGLFFSPAHNQIDNPREIRHVTAWATALQADSERSQKSNGKNNL